MDEHIIEAIGKTRVKVSNGKVVEVGEPEIEYCPIFHKYQNMETITKEKVKENIEFRIKDFGMCTENRTLRMKDFLNFGISEIINTLLCEDIVDIVVLVCEGCGTVLIDDAEMVQGIGGRVSGLVKTSPIPKIIDEIGEENVVDYENASINQVGGVRIAVEKGYKNIAVTLAGAGDLEELENIEKENPDVNIYKFAVHTSKTEKEDARKMVESCDVITGCASKNIRKLAGDKALYSVGEEIPIFALTEDGVEFLKLRLDKIGGVSKKEDPKSPHPLI